MTATTLRARSDLARAQLLCVALGVGWLVVRPTVVTWGANAQLLAGGYLITGAAALLVPVRAQKMPLVPRQTGLGVGLVAVTVAATLGGWPGRAPLQGSALPLALLAALAEELVFRRALYGWLSRHGAVVAIVGSAVLFAVVHLPAYGVAALPVDLGAGLLLSWQRWDRQLGSARPDSYVSQRSGGDPAMKIVVRLLCVLALLLPAACTQQHEGPTLRIGALYPLNGTQGPGGVEEFHGVETAVRLINADGGIAGRPVRLDSVDVPSAGLAVAGVRRLADAGVKVILGSYGSTISAPAALEAQRRGRVFWETGAVGDIMAPGQGTRIFRFPPTGESLGRQAIDFITDRFAPRAHIGRQSLRFAVVGVDDAYGSSVMAGAIAELASRGLRPVVDVRYNPLDYDRRAIIRKVAAANPDITFAAAYLDDAVALRREMVHQHLRLVTGIGTSSSYCHLEFGTTLGRDAVGLFASDKPDADALNPTGLLPDARQLLARAEADYHSRYGASMTAAALTGFSGTWALLHEVLRRAGSDDPTAVARAAQQVRIPEGGLPNGSGLAFSPPGAPDAGANLRAASVIWEWVAPGERVVIWPQRFATHHLQMLQVAG